MSLITSCPACGTMFRVVPDQLKISEGWVRCGHCSEVFDATAHLVEYEQLPAQDDPLTEPADVPTQPPDWDFLPPENPDRRPPVDPSQPAVRGTKAVVAPPTAPAPSPRIDFGPEETAVARDYPPFRRSALDPAEADPSLPLAARGRDSRPADSRAHEQSAPVVQEQADLEQVSFVRQARRKAFWRRPWMRLLLGVLFLLSAAALLLQVAYQDRDRLAASHPPLAPWLERMCEFLQCRIQPARQVEAIVIESSGFNRLRNDTYRLAFTLRNTVSTPVAVPSLELTLTDALDQPVLRRVLTPEELGAKAPAIEGAAEWSGAVGLSVASAGPGRIAGYRLLAFYP